MKQLTSPLSFDFYIVVFISTLLPLYVFGFQFVFSLLLIHHLKNLKVIKKLKNFQEILKF